jgi:hypothetical protein
MQVSPLMDRTKAGVSKSQPGFFSIVGRPLFKTFTQASQVWLGKGGFGQFIPVVAYG